MHLLPGAPTSAARRCRWHRHDRRVEVSWHVQGFWIAGRRHQGRSDQRWSDREGWQRHKSFADLKGKTLGHVPGIQWRTISRHLVRAAGLDPDSDVKLTDLAVPMQVPAVKGGSVDATLSLEPVGSIAASTEGVGRAMVNPVAAVIADPFYSGAAVLTTKFIKERPTVAKKIVAIIDEATKLAMADFDKYKKIIPKYTAIRETQLGLLAKPYLRSFSDLNETDLNSYQSFVDVFVSEGVIKEKMDVRTKMLKMTDFAS